MQRIWVFGSVLVTVIAALKTLLVVHFAFGGVSGAPSLVVLSGLFALFFALTAVVAYVACTQLTRHVVQKRREKLAPGMSEPVAKETVILRHAPDWGCRRPRRTWRFSWPRDFPTARSRTCAAARSPR